MGRSHEENGFVGLVLCVVQDRRGRDQRQEERWEVIAWVQAKKELMSG